MSTRVQRPPEDSPAGARPSPMRSGGTHDAYHREVAPRDGEDKTLLRALWSFVAPHKLWLNVGLVTIVLGSGLTLLRPLIMMKAVDESIQTRDPKVMMLGGALFAGVAVLEQLLAFAQVYAVQILGARSTADLRAHTFRFLGKLPLSYFDRQPVGRLVTRVTNDIDAIQELFNSGALSAVGDLLGLVGVVAIMLSLDAELSLVAFCALPFIALLLYFVRSRARDAFRTIRAETARMNATMSEQVSGVGVIQAFSRETKKAREFDEINAAYRDANMRSIRYDAIQDAAIDAVSSISMASLIVALGYKGASFGTVVALSAYLTQFFYPISMLAQRYTLLQSALAGAERVIGLLETKEVDAPTWPTELGSPGSTSFAVELDGVTFAYKPGHDVLQDVSLHINPGESIALVGPTGSGKTTITSLILRLYEIQKGAIRLNGRDIRTLPREELRRNFAVVPQEVFLFEGTLAENVAAGEEPRRDKVTRVLHEMGLSDWLTTRGGGLDAEVRAGGVNFSAGERQLIAFARALYRDAPILVLDEATASIDSTTEARMQKALGALLKGRTSIIVAHRLSTIRAVDRIVVLQRGQVAERGTHDELLAHGGLYAALHRLQFSRDSANSPT